MSHDHHPSHHHHARGQAHPPAPVAASILRLSVIQRLAIALGAVAVIWAAVFWAMQS